MFAAVKKDGIIKQLSIDGTIVENSNLQENAGIEDCSAENELEPDSTGIVIATISGNGEVTSGIYLATKNLKLESTNALLSTIAEAEKIDDVTVTSTDVNVIANTNTINKISIFINNLIDLSKEQSEKL